MAKNTIKTDDLALMIVKSFEKLEKFDETASKKDFYELQNAVANSAKNVSDFKIESLSNQTAHDSYQKNFEIIEKRLLKIE
jgi:hypothetical protein